MATNRDVTPRPFDVLPTGTLRRRILEYIAQEGGELRSDSGHSLRRQICDALAEPPTRVSQALIALERGGLLEREMDIERHRCQAVRLVSRRPASRPKADQPVKHPFTRSETVDSVTAEPAGRRAELEAAERELHDLICRAAEASRRVARLRRAALHANRIPPPASNPPADLRDPDRHSLHSTAETVRT